MARSKFIPVTDGVGRNGLPLDRYGREKVDGRSRVARQAGVRGAEFDAFGNVKGGTYASAGIINPQVDSEGRTTGTKVDAGDPVQVQGTPSGLDQRSAGTLTPRLNAFAASQPAKVRQGSGVGFPSKADPRLAGTQSEFDPRLGGDLKAGTVPSEVQAEAGKLKTAMDASTRADAWGQRPGSGKQYQDGWGNTFSSGPAWREAVAAAKAKKETPVAGANAFMQNKLDVGRARVQMKSRGELASQRYADMNRPAGSDAVAKAADNSRLPESAGLAQTAKTPFGTVSVRQGPAALHDSEGHSFADHRQQPVQGLTAFDQPWIAKPNAGITTAQESVPGAVRGGQFLGDAPPSLMSNANETPGNRTVNGVNRAELMGAFKTADATARPASPASSVATSPDEKSKRKNAFGTQSFSLS